MHQIIPTAELFFFPGMEPIYQSLGTTDKHRLWVEGCGHVITEEPGRESVFKAAADFVQRVPNSA